MSRPTVSGDELVELARRLAGQAARVLLAGQARPRAAVSTKTSGTDMVTEMDRASERLIVEGILTARPDDGILGEEGTSIAGTTGVRWVVDPLDGTTNYLYGLPGFGVSIAAEVDGQTVAGVVNDPTRAEEFVALRGHGATLNGVRLRRDPAAVPPLATALLATGFAYDPAARARQAAVLVDILPLVRDIRRFGSAALDLCMVACGRVDAFYEAGLQPWDRAAGALVAEEAGYVVAGLDGEPEPPPGSVLLAAPQPLFESLRSLVAGAVDVR